MIPPHTLPPKKCSLILTYSPFQDNKGWTALMLAAGNGYSDVVSTLLSHGANTQLEVR